MLCGGRGNVGVTANLAPGLMHQLCMAAVNGDAAGAMAIQRKLMPLHKELFIEANPIPLKWAMARMGLCRGTLRLPMTPLAAAAEPVVEAALRASGLLS
jgi:4-hydroxy-tetrahydrodipicolinate synthase